MCAPSPTLGVQAAALGDWRAALAVSLRAILIACALLLAWAEIHPRLVESAASDAAPQWAQLLGPDTVGRSPAMG